MKNRFVHLGAALLLMLNISELQGAVKGCESVGNDYRPYRQWTDLPKTLDGLRDYVPITHWPDRSDPRVVDETTEATDITIIYLHGKNGSPWFQNLTTLAQELASKGYKIVIPTMPWGRKMYFTLNTDKTAWINHTYFAWDGNMCEGLNYIESLVAAERAIGRRVLLMGHSMGGEHALLYGYLNKRDDIIGIITSAPGGFVPLSSVLMENTASSRLKAKQLAANGKGNARTWFDTYNMGEIQKIYTTANNYLSFHEPDSDLTPDARYLPDMRNALPNITEPVLWLVGQNDSLVSFYNNNQLPGRLPNQRSRYQVLQGDHLTVMFHESQPIDDWFTGWSSIQPADRDQDGVPDKNDAFPDKPKRSEKSDILQKILPLLIEK